MHFTTLIASKCKLLKVIKESRVRFAYQISNFWGIEMQLHRHSFLEIYRICIDK